GAGGPELADDVVGRALRQQTPQRPPAGREVASDPGRAGCAEQGSEQAPAAQGGEAADRPGRGAGSERPPVGAVCGLGLDPRLRSELAEFGYDPLGGPSLAVGGGGALDPLQLLDQPPQPLLVDRHRARPYRGPTIQACSPEAR